MLLLLLVGAGLRFIRVADPLVEFHSTRQYHSALLAREYEQAIGGSGAGVDDAVVAAAAPAEIELPVMEVLTALGWRIAGSEPLWLPRTISIMAWTGGGWMLFLLIRRLSSQFGALVGTAVWSLLPFGIAGSRTFQPDPGMVVAIVGATLALVAYDDAPTRRRLVVAGGSAGLALLIKSPAAFFIAPVFLVLRWRAEGARLLRSRTTWIYASLFLVPTLVYYIYGFMIGGFLNGQDGGRVVPDLLLTVLFWKRWAYLVVDNIGPVLPVFAAIGVIVARGRARVVGVSLFVGYVAFGLVFTVHYSTHSYYHLPAVMIIAIGCGMLADWARPHIGSFSRKSTAAAVGATLVLVIVGASFTPFTFRPPLISDKTLRAEVEAPREIRKLIPDASGVVFLAPSFGFSLMFHAGLVGVPWDTEASDFTAVEAQFADFETQPDLSFFVVTDMDAWQAQPTLQSHLDANFAVVGASNDFMVYDLRARPG